MKYCLDPAVCKKEGVPIDTALYLLSLYLGKEISTKTFNDVCSRGGIVYTGFTRTREPINVQITQQGIDLIEKIVLDSEFRDPNSEGDFYEDLAGKMRDLYPEGTKPGTNIKWKDSVPIIAKRLKTLVKKYKVTFTKEEALDATRRYVEQHKSDNTFMHVLKYFICKYDSKTGEENSEFLSYLANTEEEPKHNSSEQFFDFGEL